MANESSTLSELKAAIAALPPSPPGTVRVFRGQTRDYPSLAPSGLRRTPRARAIWHAYSGHLYAGLMSEVREHTTDLSMVDLQAHSLWFEAVAQHYGPGSDFLDVTHSLDMALWFALNKSRMVKASNVIGPDGPPDPINDHPTSMDLVRYGPWTETGYLYVFDLPLWDGEGIAKPGTVVDLARAPEIFASSARIRTQSGCLVYCRNRDGSALDLRKLLTGGKPLQVRRPMTGAAMLDRRVADIYPSPKEDAWFARLLSVPMTYAPQPPPPTLQRPIPVMVYFDPDNRRYVEEVHFHDVAVHPPLVHRMIPEDRKGAQPLTVVVLEAPMVFPYPPGDSELWHHGLLWTDVPDRCVEYAFGQAAPERVVALDNVLFEFSLLEQIGWERVVNEGAKITSRRGVWMRRTGEQREAAILDQQVPGDGVHVSAFIPLRYDAVRQRIMVTPPQDGPLPFPIDTVAEIAKPIIIALMLLRHLSPAMKCEPSPRVSMRTGETQKILLGVARDAARLYRVRAGEPNSDWFVLRDAGNPEEPFTDATQRAGMIELETKLPFRDIPLAELKAGLQRS
jgi:hypothetical protein